jgi:formylglycine-generating enzyme required for sulfatase activity
MRKKPRQKAIFSTIAGLGAEPAPKGPIAADGPPNVGQEEIHRPTGPKPPVHQKVFSKSPEARVPQLPTTPPHEATRQLMPESVPVPTEESLAPAAAQELPNTHSRATEADTPIVPGPAGTETLSEDPPSLFSSLKLGAESLDFGRVLVGNFADLDLAVENEGNCPCVLTDLRGLPDAGFTLIAVPNLPLALGPAGSQLFTVRFSPDSVGKKTANLAVVLKDQNGPEPEVRLTGEAARTVTTPQGIYYSPVFNSQEMSLVYIPSGSFVMGSPEDEPGRNHDEKQYEVTLNRGFYLQSTPVTQRQWQSVTGDNPTSSSAGGDYPVENVSWHECQVFIQKLNLLGEGVYRLPTEAEWEYACRAGGAAALGDRELTALFCEYDPFIDAVAWYCGNSDKHSHPVALKNPNPWDLYDMHGNVMEWCQDWYGEYPAGAATDPAGPPAGVGKVIRGGSWFNSAKNCRAACRAKRAPTSRSPYLGLRLVKELE